MTADDDLRALAVRQYSLVSLEQARMFLGPNALRHRLSQRDWEHLTPRVLGLVGVAPGWRRTLMAATLDGGGRTYVGRLAAAALWRLPGFGPGPLETTREKSIRSRPPSIGRLYTVRYLPEHLTAAVDGIPVVSLPFLLYQLAGIVHPARAERALDTVTTRSPAVLVRLHELLPELAERGRNGIVFMRDYLDRNPIGTRVVESGLEKRFERIIREAGEAPLERQVDVGGHEFIGRVDYLDRELSIIFEVDSELHHTSPLDVERDAVRDEALLAAGFRAVERIRGEWIWNEPERAVAVVRDARRRIRAEIRRSGS